MGKNAASNRGHRATAEDSYTEVGPAGAFALMSCFGCVQMRPLVPDRIRLWKAGVRELVMDLCCALHNFRVRLIPWQPMT